MKEKERKVKISKEAISHFRCESCDKWWSIGDAPQRKTWFCPWCGKKGEVKNGT